MVRLRNREIQSTSRNGKTAKSEDAFDPVQLYQRYINTIQMNPKARDVPLNATARGGPATTRRPLLQQKAPMPVRQPASAMDMKRSKSSRIRSKPSVELTTARTKTRPKTPASKKKPVDSLEEYEMPNDKKVTFEADEIECFFDALKETVEEVVHAKLSTMVNTVIDSLTRKIEEVTNKSQRIEGALTNLCGELNSKISYYGEEHSRHFRYICMKLEYDKIFYQHMNNLIHPESRLPENSVQSSQNLPQQDSQQSNQTFASASQPPSSIHQLPDMFDAIPTCSHHLYQQARETPSQQLPPGWPHQAGDSVLDSQLAQISQTARQFSHSPFGPFQRVAACQTSRSCPKQMDKAATSTSDSPNENASLAKRLSQSKSVDVAFASSGNDKVQLGIKEFLDTLKVFQSNLNSRDTLVKGDLTTPIEAKPLKGNSTLSLMDTDDSISEGGVSNGVSISSSEDDSSHGAENTS